MPNLCPLKFYLFYLASGKEKAAIFRNKDRERKKFVAARSRRVKK